MDTSPSLQDLIELSYYYFPKGVESYEDSYEQTEEIRRRTDKMESLQREKEKGIYRFLKKRFGKKNIDDMTLFHLFPCFHYRFTIKNNGEHRTYVINVSAIAPVFYIYKEPVGRINKENIFGNSILDDQDKQFIEGFKKEVMNEFPHLHYFKEEWLSVKVADISLGNHGIGEVFLYYSILTDHIY